MTTAFVLGNGVSRKSIDLTSLLKIGDVYGCNALYRTFTPTVLVSTDTPISEAIQHSGYSAKYTHYTRKPIPGLGAIRIPQQYFGYSSGPTAIGIAAQRQYQQIYLIGFDLGPTNLGMFNNIYADTEFYKKSSSISTYTGNWVRQIVTIATEHSTTKFIRVYGNTTAIIDEFNNLPNMQHMQVEDFVDRINSKKDF